MKNYDIDVLRILRSNLVVELSLGQLYELSSAIEDLIEKREYYEKESDIRISKVRRK